MRTEFEFIARLRKESRIQNTNSKIQTGIGDDCAVIRQNSKSDLVITTDLLIEDIDFRRAWTKPEFLGHKALAVSLSDVAAMGAKPLWALVSIGVPADIWQTDFVERFYQGWFKLAEKFRVELVGGDVSRTPDKIVIDSIVAGEVKKNRAILRAGAATGDLIFVTGNLGGASGGLKLLENGLRFETAEKGFERNLIVRQLIPNPQTEIGMMLGKKGLATTMIDLSDGLSSDLTHLCAASNVGADIEAAKIPSDVNLSSIHKLFPETFSPALDGGEDFELLFTVNPKNKEKINKLLPAVFCIGRITDKTNKIRLIKDSETVLIQPQGFSHF